MRGEAPPAGTGDAHPRTKARGQSTPQRDTGWRLAGSRVLSVDAETAMRNRSRHFFALGEGEVVKDTTRGLLRERSSHRRPV